MNDDTPPSACGIPRSVLWTVAAASLAAALTRVLTRSRTLVEWDPVNFALALDRIDLVHHQPHPPAAIGYVVVGRLLHTVFADANTALVVWNVLLTFASGLLIFALAFHASTRARQSHGWLAWTCLTASPLFWFYGSVAEIYVSEMALSLLVAFFCVRTLQGSARHAYAVAAALAHGPDPHKRLLCQPMSFLRLRHFLSDSFIWDVQSMQKDASWA